MRSQLLTFPAFCPRGHRFIPSTGQCYEVRELKTEPDGVRVFEYSYNNACGSGEEPAP